MRTGTSLSYPIVVLEDRQLSRQTLNLSWAPFSMESGKINQESETLNGNSYVCQS